MALNTLLVGATPFTITRAHGLENSSVAAFTKPVPPRAGKDALFPGVGRKQSAAMQKPAASAMSLCHIRSVDDPFIVIDNGDDFTYGFCQYICELRTNFEFYHNSEVTVAGLRRKNPRAIFISPGPGMPQDSGVSIQAIQELGPSIPIFGACLGLQCICEAFGGKIVSVPSDLVNKESHKVYFNRGSKMGLFDNFYRPFLVSEHDNHVVDKETFPHDTLEITAWTEDGLVMAAQHKKYNHIQGIQFIPEHIIMDEGKRIVFSFIKFVEEMEDKAAKEERAAKKVDKLWEAEASDAEEDFLYY